MRATKLVPVDVLVEALFVRFGTEECKHLMSDGWRAVDNYRDNDIALLIYQKYLH